ncbi:hypothetical protein KJ853_01725 [Patescibacteria group bacterium]|nr:hypothetical protein [Patescibacteria group bacterium]
MKIQAIKKEELLRLYSKEQKSVTEIAKKFRCSAGRINYWLFKYRISKRSISEAIYIKHNPEGDPFRFVLPKNLKEAELFGLGIGLYWGEGTKANKTTVRIGNSDPALLKKFIEFLVKFFSISKDDLKFHLHTFTDIDIEEAREYWMKRLGIKKGQFYKPFVSITGKLGKYRNKSKYGVLTLYYGNIKVRNILISLLPL